LLNEAVRNVVVRQGNFCIFVSQLNNKDMELNRNVKAAIVEMLQDVDGEDMQEIIINVGMQEQMLRQLMLTMPIEQVEYLIEERKDLDSQK
jgi:hypothetical protein